MQPLREVLQSVHTIYQRLRHELTASALQRGQAPHVRSPRDVDLSHSRSSSSTSGLSLHKKAKLYTIPPLREHLRQNGTHGYQLMEGLRMIALIPNAIQ